MASKPVLIALVLVIALASAVDASLRNVKVIRKINLAGNEAAHKIGVRVKNDGNEPAQHYRIAIPNQQAARLAECMLYDDDISFKSICSRTSDTYDDATIYEVAFPQALPPKETAKLWIRIVFTHFCQPYPKAIPQGALPYVKVDDSAVLLSPYKTDTQTTKFNLGTRNIISSTGPKKMQINDRIEYGPYENVEPFSSEPISIHFMHDKAFATVTDLVKHVEVSHWGNVAVEESYLIRNDGPLLKGEYSRLDYDSGSVSTSGVFQWLVAHLHPHAKDLYYRDSIGNVSTSRIRPMRDQVRLEIATRFPIFGGWKTDFYIGYNIPAQYALYSAKAGERKRFVLNIPFGTNFESLVIDELTVKIVLPEGATNIAWEAPYSEVVETEQGLLRTFLDTMGRPMLVLKKRNVVSGYHGNDFQITYDFDDYAILREPLLLFAGFFMFFVASIAYMRIDLSLKVSRKRSLKAATPKATFTNFLHLCENNVEDARLSAAKQEFIISLSDSETMNTVESQMSILWSLRREFHSEAFQAQVARIRKTISS